MNYTPDKWIIIFINKNEEKIYKVLAGWSGSYLEGQSWKINSGITKVEDYEDYFLFHGYTASTYQCYKTAYGVNSITASILSEIKKQSNDELVIENLSKDEAFKKCFNTQEGW